MQTAPHTDSVIERVIDWSARNKLMVFLLVGALFLGGLYCMRKTPLDAIPDLSDVQVIVYTPWEGRSPDLVEGYLDLVADEMFTCADAGSSGMMSKFMP